MNPADWAILIGAIVALVTAVGTGALFIAGVRHRAAQAEKDLEDHKTRNEADLAEIKARLTAMEGHRAEVAVLSAQMGMVIERIAKLSEDVQSLTQALLARE